MLRNFLKAGLCIQCKRASFARKTNLFSVNYRSIRNASSENHDDDDDLNKPIKYSTSPAATWRAAESRDPLIDRHPYETDIMMISLAIFMLYFFVLREENDIDLLFDKDLSSHFPNANFTPSVSHSK